MEEPFLFRLNLHRHDRACIAQAIPRIPFDAYHLCIFVRHRTLELVFTSISLVYGALVRYTIPPAVLIPRITHESDSLAFSLIIFMAAALRAPGLKVPGILRTIAQDSTRYFMVIFTSYFVLTMTLTLGRVSVAIPLSAPPRLTRVHPANCSTHSSCVSYHASLVFP